MRRSRLIDADGVTAAAFVSMAASHSASAAGAHRMGVNGNLELFAGQRALERLVIGANQPLPLDQAAERAEQQRIFARFDRRLNLLKIERLLPLGRRIADDTKRCGRPNRGSSLASISSPDLHLKIARVLSALDPCDLMIRVGPHADLDGRGVGRPASEFLDPSPWRSRSVCRKGPEVR